MSLKFTDVKPMIQRKILRNALAQELLKTHVTIFQKEIEIRQLYISSCQAKFAMLNTMNLIEKMQLNEYSIAREESILETSESLKEMDNNFIKDIQIMRDDVKKIKDSSGIISGQILQLNETIPKEGIATNYQVKYNSNDSMGGRCIP